MVCWRFQSRRGSIHDGVRCQTRPMVVDAAATKVGERGRCRTRRRSGTVLLVLQVTPHMRRQRSTTTQEGEIVGMPRQQRHLRNVAGWRSGHAPVPRRGTRTCRPGFRVAASLRLRAMNVVGRPRCKCRCRRRCRFFHRSSVMTLMPCQGRTACKRLLTVGIWALVRSFAGVYSTMPC